jgi:hypothetical protein
MTTAEIDALTVEGLRYFPLQQFLEQYTAQVETLIQARTTDAEARFKEAQARSEALTGQCAELRAEIAQYKARLAAHESAPPPVLDLEAPAASSDDIARTTEAAILASELPAVLPAAASAELTNADA